MNYYLYRVTNKVNGKIYVGVHKTSQMDDGYMGSGKIIGRAIEKHGIENFQKEILEHFYDAATMYEREKEVVNDEFLARPDVYNLRRGGYGGFDHINSKGLNVSLNEQEARNPGMKKAAGHKGWKAYQARLTDPEFSDRMSRTRSANRKKRIQNNPDLKFKNGNSDFEAKKSAAIKRSAALGRYKGSKGTMWITDGLQNKRVPVGFDLCEGWRPGKIQKTMSAWQSGDAVGCKPSYAGSIPVADSKVDAGS